MNRGRDGRPVRKVLTSALNKETASLTVQIIFLVKTGFFYDSVGLASPGKRWVWLTHILHENRTYKTMPIKASLKSIIIKSIDMSFPYSPPKNLIFML